MTENITFPQLRWRVALTKTLTTNLSSPPFVTQSESMATKCVVWINCYIIIKLVVFFFSRLFHNFIPSENMLILRCWSQEYQTIKPTDHGFIVMNLKIYWTRHQSSIFAIERLKMGDLSPYWVISPARLLSEKSYAERSEAGKFLNLNFEKKAIY